MWVELKFAMWWQAGKFSMSVAENMIYQQATSNYDAGAR
jgi:hypothetical protein